MNTPSFAVSYAPTALLPALRGVLGIIGGFEIDLDETEYRKLPLPDQLPYPPLNLGEYDVVFLSCQEISTINVVFSLLTYGYNVEEVAGHLWELLKQDETVNQLLEIFIIVEKSSIPALDTADSEYLYPCRKTTITLTPHPKHSWERISQALSHSNHFRNVLQNFARSYLENLLIPFMTPQPPPPISPNTNGQIQSAMKSLLIARDGHRTVVGGVWNYDRPEDLIINDEERQEVVEEDYVVPTHVIPFFAGSGGGINHKLVYYMRKFCGYNTAEQVMMQSYDEINSPINGLVLNPELYNSFRKLRWCIEAESVSTSKELWPGAWEEQDTDDEDQQQRKYTVYRVRLLTRGKQGSLHLHNDKDILHFGSSYDGIPGPSALYCNVHASMAKVLRASGAGGAVEAILRNEQTMKEDASTGANWGDLGRDYLVRRLSAISVEGL